MFRIRPAREADLPSLLGLAHTGNYINLPPFEDRLAEIVDRSSRCFAAAAASPTPPDGHDRAADRYLFVVDDGTGNCVGTSSIRGGMGNAQHPNLSFQLLRVVRRSEILRKDDEASKTPIVAGSSEHIYAVLFQDPFGPTELGGNVLHPDLRSQGIGKLLSFSRFHYLRAHRAWFSDRLLAEMMAPIEPYNDGNAFWRQVVRPFIGLTYQNADRLSTRDSAREFMYELLPRIVNISLLDDAVLEMLSSVGPYTRSAEGMLRSIGFQDSFRVDPFDAGLHLEARLSRLKFLEGAQHRVAATVDPPKRAVDAIVSNETPDGQFQAVRSPVEVVDEGARISDGAAVSLGAGLGENVRVSRLDYEPMPSRKRGVGIPTIDLKSESERVQRERDDDIPLAALNVADFARIIERELDIIRDGLQDS